MTRSLHDGLQLAFYGDDFTGSTDAMEVTALAGLKTVLFTRTPDDEMRRAFADYAVIGVAGTARARSPEWMDANLPQVFETLAGFSPRVLQYKVCSTFDSAPHIGSIGRAIDIGTLVTGGRWSPSVVGAPNLGRWQVFSNLFAAAGGVRYRIDRHPTMAHHPVTPMHEADLRVHLGAQTDRPVRGIDHVALTSDDAMIPAGDCPVVFLDVFDRATQEAAGRMIWDGPDPIVFSASSSGLQYALVAHWRRTGLLAETAPSLPAARPARRLIILSGSCSPVTAEQIGAAEKAGFATLRLDVVAAVEPASAEAERARLLEALDGAYRTGRAALVFAARTVDDPAFEALKSHCERTGRDFADAQDALGRFLGALALEAVPRLDIDRLVAAGGDTSGRIVEALPIDALEVAHPLAKGAPLCRAYSRTDRFDRLELVLKGGQIGGPDIFAEALAD